MARNVRYRMALQERLLRAHKFVHLVDALGVGVLNAVPVVSVTHLERIPLEHIRLLPSSMAGKDILDAARRICRGFLAN